jgi:cytochrome c oxidase subunit II
MNYLILIAVILGIIVLVRLMTVVQLSMALTNAENDEEQIRHNKSNGIGFIIFMVAGLGLMVYMTIRYSAYMLPVAASEHGPGIDSLLNINFLIIGIAFFVTQIMLFYFANKYRHNHERKAFYYPDDHKLEIIWTVVPAIVLTALIITGLKQWNGILMTDKKDAVHVQLYGYQFAWITRYSGADNTLGKSNYKMITDENPLGIDTRDKAAQDDIYTAGQEMHLPLGQGIMFQFNSRDGIHSAYMPHFRTQMNVVPGMNTSFYMKPTISTAEMRKITKNDKFDYVLLCNKICGVAHYTMKMKIVVESQADFDAWLKTQKKVAEIPAAQPMIKTADNAAEVKTTPAI